MSHQPNFENWLEERFIALDEAGGIPITKDNCEDMFDRYLQELDTKELIFLADIYALRMYRLGQEEN